MSHSYQKIPIVGYRSSEKHFKQAINRHFRRIQRHQLAKEAVSTLDFWLPVRLREISNARDLPKSPRIYSRRIGPRSKLFRK